MRLPCRRPLQRNQTPAAAPIAQPARMQVIYETLRAYDVEYVTIGGVAVQAYGHPRTTQDIDILVDPAPENLERLAGALRLLDARLTGVDADLLGTDPGNAADLAAGANLTLLTRGGALDVWTDPTTLPGARGWSELRAAAVDVHTPDGGLVRVIGRDDLIRLKHAAAALEHRPEAKRRQDLDDIAVLEAARRLDQPHERQPRARAREERDPPGPDIGV